MHADLPGKQITSRVKMHEIEMLRLPDHDILSSIDTPYLQESDRVDMTSHEWSSDMEGRPIFVCGG